MLLIFKKNNNKQSLKFDPVTQKKTWYVKYNKTIITLHFVQYDVLWWVICQIYFYFQSESSGSNLFDMKKDKDSDESDVTEESDVSDEREEEEEETKDDKVRTYLPLMVTIPSLVEHVESFN